MRIAVGIASGALFIVAGLLYRASIREFERAWRVNSGGE
jgi:hypothetical protein